MLVYLLLTYDLRRESFSLLDSINMVEKARGHRMTTEELLWCLYDYANWDPNDSYEKHE